MTLRNLTPSRLAMVALILGVPVGLVVALAAGLRDGLVAGAVGALAGSLLAGWMWVFSKVVLGPDGLQVPRTGTIEWSRIQEIALAGDTGIACPTLWLDDRTELPLWALVGTGRRPGSLATAADHAVLLREHWIGHRGVDWRPATWLPTVVPPNVGTDPTALPDLIDELGGNGFAALAGLVWFWFSWSRVQSTAGGELRHWSDFALWLLPGLLLRRWYGSVRLSPYGLDRGRGRGRRIAWTRVRDVHLTDGRWGAHPVVITDGDRVVHLRSLGLFLGLGRPRAEKAVECLRRTWVQHR